MQKWEHIVLEINRRESSSAKFYLDKVGEQGYELITVVHESDFRFYYFKRLVVEASVVGQEKEESPIIKKMTEAEKKKEIDEILRRTNSFVPPKNKK
jgi:hypothetical protein